MLFDIIIKVFVWLGVKLIDTIPGKLLDALFGLFKWKRGDRKKQMEQILLYPADCGSGPIKLKYRQPYIVEAFGSYFTSLLEDSQAYLRIYEQIYCPSSPETSNFEPISRILYELRKPTGPRILIIAAAGGMGKTTLATKIVKCLVEQEDVQFILGDSAKTTHTNPATGDVYQLDPTFTDVRSFYRKLYAQIGLPIPSARLSITRMQDELLQQLKDFPSVLVIDNLDTILRPDQLLASVYPFLNNNLRVVVTTRERPKINDKSVLTVDLMPIKEVQSSQAFLRWHIAHFQNDAMFSSEIEKVINDTAKVKKIITKTGGIPLIMQLALNDVQTKSWEYIEKLPQLHFSSQLLDYLYKERWEDLRRLGNIGVISQNLVGYIAERQSKGKKLGFAELQKWAHQNDVGLEFIDALKELERRFLIVNRDMEQGNFSVFPSFTDFLEKEAERND